MGVDQRWRNKSCCCLPVTWLASLWASDLAIGWLEATQWWWCSGFAGRKEFDWFNNSRTRETSKNASKWVTRIPKAKCRLYVNTSKNRKGRKQEFFRFKSCGWWCASAARRNGWVQSKLLLMANNKQTCPQIQLHACAGLGWNTCPLWCSQTHF